MKRCFGRLTSSMNSYGPTRRMPRTSRGHSRNGLVSMLFASLLIAALGCGDPESHFPVNRVYLKKQELAAQLELSDQQRQDIVGVLELLFGTPDAPRVPDLAGLDVSLALPLEKLRFAAGPVSSDQSGRQLGLYRKHCAHCHGLSGDGAGPTAWFLEPYPRDFRRGIFKYKSTPGPLAPPTHDDLASQIRSGNPGSGMPAFNLLSGDELEALVGYVKYLSIRGEVERALIFESIDQLDEYDRLIDLSLQEEDPDEFAEQLDPIKATLSGIVRRWLDAPNQVTQVPPPPAGWNSADSIRRGQELFTGNVANCVKCHGLDRARRRPERRLRRLGARNRGPAEPGRHRSLPGRGRLPPSPAQPRNLQYGLYRGGSRPEDIYRRIHNGIAGTPMPAAALQPAGANPTTSG